MAHRDMRLRSEFRAYALRRYAMLLIAELEYGRSDIDRAVERAGERYREVLPAFATVRHFRPPSASFSVRLLRCLLERVPAAIWREVIDDVTMLSEAE